ncbi:MAG: DUF58 domain-containing protein [Chloroflexi bacterium]|nr:MAG: DUF58 domain-containing protein [Chloroflexota bacterium]
MTVRRPFWGVLILLILSGAAAYFTPMVSGTATPVFFTRLVYLCLLLLGLGWLWAYYAVRGFNLLREARVMRQQVGEVFEERYKVSNRYSFVRLWIEVRDESELPGKTGSRVLSLIGGRQQRSYVAYTKLNRRGSFHLGPTRLVSGDPFGLFLNSSSIESRNELVVLPYVVELQKFPSPGGMFPGGRAVRRRALDITPQASGVRDYAPGDALRRIHWPTSVRRDRLMAKEFDQDPQADVWIFLDAYGPVHYRAQEEEQAPAQRVDQLWLWQHKVENKLPADTFEFAVSAAGSVANFYIRQGRTVGFVCASDVFTVISPERGERQLNKILETLTFLNSDGDLPLIALIEAQAPSLPRASTVVLITASTDPTFDVAVDYLIMRNLRPVIVYIDGSTFGSDLGGGEVVFRLRQRGVPVVQVQKDEDLREALERLAE